MGNEVGQLIDCNGIDEKDGKKRRHSGIEHIARCLADVDTDDECLFDDAYDFDPQILGTGRFSIVHTCWRKGEPDNKFAVKVIDRTMAGSVSLNRIQSEITILQKLDGHDALIKLVDVDQSSCDCIRLVMELCDGGELYDRIKELKNYSENDARSCVFNLNSAMKYVHNNGIMHRDLKPENILLVGRRSHTDIKISDFGLAKMSEDFPKKLPRATSILGSDFYLAPELIAQQEYGREIDVWACGVITYILLSGSLPFFSNVLHKLYRQIVERELRFSEPVWGRVSTTAKDFILRMMEVRPTERLTADGALKHSWLQNARDR